MTYFSPIELLESRIAPAGIVTLSFLGADLRVDGDNANNSLTITESGPNVLTVTPDPTTQVKFGTITGAAGAAVQIPGRIGGNLFANLQGGLDKLTLTNLTVGGSLLFTDTAGDNSLSLGAVKVSGNLAVTTGFGADDVTFTGAYVLIGGALTASLGDGVNNLGGIATTVSIGGALRYFGGANADTLSFNDTEFHTGGGIAFLGNDGANSFAILGANTHVGGGIAILNLATSTANHTANISTSGEILGTIKIANGNGTNTTSLGTTSSLFIAGNLEVTGGAGVDTVNTPSAVALKIGGSIKVAQGAGDDVFNFAPGSVQVGGGVTLNAGDGKNTNTLSAITECAVAGVVTFANGKGTGSGTSNTISGGQNLRVGGIVITNSSTLATDSYTNTITSVHLLDQGGLSIFGGPGADAVTINSPVLTVRGATFIAQGDGANTLNVAASVGSTLGTFGVRSGGGNDTATFTGGVAKLASFGIAAGDGKNTVTFNPASSIVQGHFSIVNGNTAAGTSVTTIDSPGNGVLRVGGSLSILNGDGASSATLGGISRIGGGVLFKTTSATAATSFTVNGGAHRISGGLTVLTGGGADTVSIVPQILNAGGAVIASLGAGDDTFRLNATGSILGISVDFGTGGSTGVVAGGSGGPLAIEGVARILGASAVTNTATLSLFNTSIRGAAIIALGDGATTAALDDIHARSTFTVLTGGGADSISFEQSGANFQSVFDSIVKISTGAAGDTLRIGKNLITDRAIFKSSVLLDGGAGTDTATVLPGNSYLPGQPVNVLASFETLA